MSLFPVEKQIVQRGRNFGAWTNPDGSVTQRVYSRPVHRLDAQGKWVEMDNRILAPWKFQVDGKVLEFTLGKLQVKNAAGAVRDIATPDLTTASTFGNRTACSPYPNVEITHEVGIGGLKETILIKAVPALPGGAFKPKWVTISGTLTGAEAFPRKALDAWDYTGAHGACYLNWDGDKFEIGIDVDWLRTTVLPITIDPTINTEGNDVSTYRTVKVSTVHQKLFVKFDVTSIPDTATISAATLNLYCTQNDAAAKTFYSRRWISQTWLETDAYGTLDAITMGANLGTYTQLDFNASAYNAFNVRKGDNSDGIEADVSGGNQYHTCGLFYSSAAAATGSLNTDTLYLFTGATGSTTVVKFNSAEGTNVPYLDVTYTGGAAALTLDQKYSRWYRDNKALHNATADAAENTSINVAAGAVKRIRIGVYSGGSGSSQNLARSLQWRVAGGSWASIATATGSSIYLYDSSRFADGTSTGERLTNAGTTFRAGEGKDTGTTTGTYAGFGTSQKVEDEWCLQFKSTNPAGSSYQFREVKSDSTTFDTYSYTPWAQIYLPPTLELAHFRWYNDDAGLNTATAKTAEDGALTIAPGDIYRLRTAVFGGSANLGTLNFGRQLQWRLSTGTWAAIGVSSSELAYLHDSTYFADGAATTERLTAGGKTFRAGEGKDTESTTSVYTGFTKDDKIEDEWPIHFSSSLTNGQIVQFRLVQDDDFVLDVYTSWPGSDGTSPTVVVPPAFDQAHFCFYGDNANINEATSAAAQDANITVPAWGVKRLRIGVYNNAGTSSIGRQLQWRVAGGTWASCAADSAAAIYLYGSPYFASGVSTIERLSTSGKTFLAGEGWDSVGVATATTLGSTQKVEDEWCLRVGAAAVAGSSYELRVVEGSDVALQTYTQVPSLTVQSPLRTGASLTVIGLALEGSYGVPKASPSWFYPWVLSEGIEPTRGPLEPRYLTGDRFLRPPAPGEYVNAGDMTCIFGPENFHKLLYSMFSTLSTANPVSGVYQHTFSVGNTLPSMELRTFKRYVEQAYHGLLVDSLELTCQRNGLLLARLHLVAQHGEILTSGTVSTSPVLSTLMPFTNLKGSVERDDVVTTDLEACSLRINFNALTFKRHGAAYVTDVVPGKVEANWDCTFAFSSDTEMRRFLGSATGTNNQQVTNMLSPFKFEWLFETGESPGTGYNYGLTVRAYSTIYQSFPQGVSSDNALLQGLPACVIRHSPSAGKDLELVLTNSIAGATIVA